MTIETTQYYDEFLRYHEMAKRQQFESNLGRVSHINSSVQDDLMKNVTLYDVVERKYAGFTQVLLDMRYGLTEEHPYYNNMQNERIDIAKNFTGWYKKRSLPEMLYVFMIHRLTGSGINYAKQPSGYYNTVMPELYKAQTIQEMSDVFLQHKPSKYTSCGYQFPAFPKPEKGFVRGGDYFIVRILPKLIDDFAPWLINGNKKDLREVGEYLFEWNRKHGLRAYKFQYAAFIADIADFYPEYVNTMSPFYYGTNAVECISYMGIQTSKMKGEKFLDAVMERAEKDTGFTAYNIEDQMCDCIRWIENYIKPGDAYTNLNRDKIWSSHKIVDHPFGRQKPMLDLGLIKSFNELDKHPSDDFVLKNNNMSVQNYKKEVKNLYSIN